MSSEKFADILVDKIKELYELYVSYIYKNDNIRLTIIIGNNKIKFYLLKDKMAIDEFRFSFSYNEKVIYEYVSVMFLIDLFKNVVIHNDKIVFYNDRHMPYLKVVVIDDDILIKMKSVMDIQKYDFISGDMDLVTKIKKKIPWRYYSNKEVMNVNNRILVSRKMLG